ncbi:hypothetical protein OPV22_007970 [Ensete ventricosum]|uniref:Uncharacterized protein n=1 Tax=Ensete ventricosum TaxID=4639 RepID=A0AAV8RCA8_ENSVE|nr:hypothetical protein OPV22_007970 [Ensete ventricosum]
MSVVGEEPLGDHKGMDLAEMSHSGMHGLARDRHRASDSDIGINHHELVIRIRAIYCPPKATTREGSRSISTRLPLRASPAPLFPFPSSSLWRPDLSRLIRVRYPSLSSSSGRFHPLACCGGIGRSEFLTDVLAWEPHKLISSVVEWAFQVYPFHLMIYLPPPSIYAHDG